MAVQRTPDRYARVSVSLPDDPKIEEAGEEASWLFVKGVLFSADKINDGFIPEARVWKLTSWPRPRVTKLAARLVMVGLWEKVEGGYRAPAFLRWNRSAEQVAEIKAKRAEAGGKGGATSKQSDEQSGSKVLSKEQAKSKQLPPPDEQTTDDRTRLKLKNDDDVIPTAPGSSSSLLDRLVSCKIPLRDAEQYLTTMTPEWLEGLVRAMQADPPAKPGAWASRAVVDQWTWTDDAEPTPAPDTNGTSRRYENPVDPSTPGAEACPTCGRTMLGECRVCSVATSMKKGMA